MRIRGIGTVKRIAGWARSWILGGPMVLGYHRVADSEWDPQHLCVSPKNFAEQLEVLTQTANAITQEQLTNAVTQDSDLKHSFVVTIDDGYADTLETATPILQRFSVPATAFITTGLIGRSFWWCDIQQIVSEAAELPAVISINVDSHEFHWSRSADTPRERTKLMRRLGDLFRELPFDRQDEVLGRLRTVFSSGSPTALIKAMTPEQIAELARSDLVEIGSHAVTHTSLQFLGIEEQKVELQKSKTELEEICGQLVTSCSYPNGRFTSATPAIARELGYLSGFTSREELVAPGCDPLLLPRLWVGDWDGDRFSRWLRWWLRKPHRRQLSG